jgi:uncharacterized protein (DUF433 family)
MQLPDFLTRTADGEIRLSGHRIGLHHVVHYYNEGYSPEMLVCQYPTLPLALVHKTIAFYLENQAEVDAGMQQGREAMESARAVGKHLDVAELRQRLSALGKAQASEIATRR